MCLVLFHTNRNNKKIYLFIIVLKFISYSELILLISFQKFSVKTTDKITRNIFFIAYILDLNMPNYKNKMKTAKTIFPV